MWLLIALRLKGHKKFGETHIFTHYCTPMWTSLFTFECTRTYKRYFMEKYVCLKCRWNLDLLMNLFLNLILRAFSNVVLHQGLFELLHNHSHAGPSNPTHVTSDGKHNYRSMVHHLSLYANIHTHNTHHLSLCRYTHSINFSVNTSQKVFDLWIPRNQ